MESIVAIFLFFGIIAITAVIFTLWIAETLLKLTFRGISAVFHAPPVPMVTSNLQGVTCPLEKCHAINPTGARFCRRCGSALPQAAQVTVRRAAVW